MSKCKLLVTKYGIILALLLYLFPKAGLSQSNDTTYKLIINYVDKNATAATLALQNSFNSKFECDDYVSKLILLLNTKGYPTASIDSIFQTTTRTTIQLFLGKKYLWIKLVPTDIDKRALELSDFKEKNFFNKPIIMQQLQKVQQRILNYYENNGYPFAAVFLDSVGVDEDKINALLKVKKGVLYKVDSIRQLGNAKMSNKFLQRYLSISNGSLYNKTKLQQVNKLLLELPYVQQVQPSDITLLGSGSVVNLYLAAKKSSQVSAIIGFLPSANQNNKLQLTGDVNLNLKNAFGGGETLLATWQQLQLNSPRLNLGYQQPYIFGSKFGIDFLFDLFKKDSSFLQLQAQLGAQYLLSANQSGKLFVQWQNRFLLADGVDTVFGKATKILPPNFDVSAVNVGLDYDWNKTDYKLNPRSGNEVKIITTLGLKNIKRNSVITAIKDQTFNYNSLYDTLKAKSYQLNVQIIVAHYFPIGKQATIKTALNSGLYNSPNIFRNELFQLGGYRLLRGFTEESIYATQYAVGSVEYRYRLSLNSNLFGFVDVGVVKNKFQSINVNNNFLGTGLGLLFETKFGLLNLSYAIGKRNDIKFNI